MNPSVCEKPKVAVITATFNHAPWIGACIESVQNQTYPSWEQVIIDDGSTDATREVVQPYLTDRRIKYIRQENRGIWHLADNNNTALAASSGEFVAILEGDDLWPPDKLEKQLTVFEDASVGFSYGRVQIVDQQGVPIVEDIMRLEEWEPPSESFQASSPIPFLRDLLLLRGNVGAVSAMFRRTALEDVGGFWQPAYFPAVDFSTILRVATTYRAAFLDETLGMWRFHTGQTTDVHNLSYALGHTKAAVEHFNSLPTALHSELGITEDDIWDARRQYLADAYWRATRVAMSKKDWEIVREHATSLVKTGHAFRRFEGILSWIASILHIDLNSVIDQMATTPVGRNLVR